MASRSRYESQLAETARLVAERVGARDQAVVYQSRSGPPQVPWLEPDVGDHLSDLASAGAKAVIVCPVGFVADALATGEHAIVTGASQQFVEVLAS